MDEYYSNTTLGQKYFEETTSDYIKKIEGIVLNYDENKSSKELTHFVIIGSIGRFRI